MDGRSYITAELGSMRGVKVQTRYAVFQRLLARNTGGTWLELDKVFGNVATFALLAKTTIVNVFIAMAAPARKRHVKCLFHWCPMAIQATGFQVGAIKLVLGAAIMVKIP